MEYAIWTFEQLVELFHETATYEMDGNEVIKTYSFVDRIKYLGRDFEMLSTNKFLYVVALDGQRLVGIRKFSFSPMYRQWVSGFISVDPDYWNQGIATQLNHLTAKFLRDKKVKSLMLFSESEMGAMIGMIAKTERILKEYGIEVIKGP